MGRGAQGDIGQGAQGALQVAALVELGGGFQQEAGRGELLRRFLPCSGFRLEQPRLVETDSQLVGEGLIESDLLGAERALPREDQPERSYDLVTRPDRHADPAILRGLGGLRAIADATRQVRRVVRDHLVLEVAARARPGSRPVPSARAAA